MERSELDFVPISAVQHMAFCPRRCALVHLERLWEENIFTAEGGVLHERVHEAGREVRGNTISVRSLPLRSARLGVVGVADAVEFVRRETPGPDAIVMEGHEDWWVPFPVEYKRGRSHYKGPYQVQLCCQALCLEEMLDVRIPEGALFFGTAKRRELVTFGDELRLETEELISQLHGLFASGVTPEAKFEAKCRSCSLVDLCMPSVTQSGRSAKEYMASRLLANINESDRNQ